jgi:hypothetical protein
MPSPSVRSEAPAPRLSLPARFVGVITSPKETFASVVAHPKWLGMMALVVVAVAALAGGFMFTAVGQNAWLEQATKDATDQQYESMLKMAPYLGYGTVGFLVVAMPVLTVIISGILMAAFNATGGEATFKQVLTVVTHSGAVGVLGQLFTVPMNYARESLTSATSLIVLLPMVDERSFAGRLLSMVDLFIIWSLIVLAIGLGVLYRRRTQPIALTLFGLYAAIALAAAAVMSRLGGA